MSTSPDPIEDPIGTVTELIAVADPATVHRVVERIGGGRAKRRRLATALAADPSVLRSGCSPAAKVVGDLLLALQAAGVVGLAPPWCAECGREVTSMQRRGERRYCAPCFVRPQVCAACGNQRQVAFRDRHGRPRCNQCPDHDPDGPGRLLVELVTSIDPALSGEAVTGALQAIVTKQAHVQKLAWAVQEAPELLTGAGAQAPFPMVLRFIDALCDAGANRVLRPVCPGCGRVVALSKRRDGLRVCRRCCWAFIRWTKQQKLTTLEFPAIRRHGPTRIIDTEARWEQARRLLTDDRLKTRGPSRWAARPALRPATRDHQPAHHRSRPRQR